VGILAFYHMPSNSYSVLLQFVLGGEIRPEKIPPHTQEWHNLLGEARLIPGMISLQQCMYWMTGIEDERENKWLCG